MNRYLGKITLFDYWTFQPKLTAGGGRDRRGKTSNEPPFRWLAAIGRVSSRLIRFDSEIKQVKESRDLIGRVPSRLIRFDL
jgi:hypothetical protein